MISDNGHHGQSYETMKVNRQCGSIYSPLVNLFNYLICFDILLITIAFVLSIGNLLSKDPYMGRNYPLPYHCIVYFALGCLLTFKCFQKIGQHCQIYRHSLIACLIFLLIFAFVFVQLAYNDQHLNLFLRVILSAGSSIFFVSLYSLHVYHENKTCAN